jgi:ribosomal RNA-processing protein 12
MGRGGLKNGRPGLGDVKQKGGNNGGGAKGRVEKSKSPRGRGGWVGPK